MLLSASAAVNVTENELLSETLRDYRQCHNVHVAGTAEQAKVVSRVPAPAD